jgi:hypothetical protein
MDSNPRSPAEFGNLDVSAPPHICEEPVAAILCRCAALGSRCTPGRSIPRRVQGDDISSFATVLPIRSGISRPSIYFDSATGSFEEVLIQLTAARPWPRFAPDSPLEGSGFEPSVPPRRRGVPAEPTVVQTFRPSSISVSLVRTSTRGKASTNEKTIIEGNNLRCELDHSVAASIAAIDACQIA